MGTWLYPTLDTATAPRVRATLICSTLFAEPASNFGHTKIHPNSGGLFASARKARPVCMGQATTIISHTCSTPPDLALVLAPPRENPQLEEKV